jgi:hypothetical protein
MSSAPQTPPPRPTLEDLLRFKRAERPSPEFWSEFDRGLRQKQLAALMKQPKGWARMRPVFVRSLRWAVPATAAAAVALVVVQIPLATTSRVSPVEVAGPPVSRETVQVSAAHDVQAMFAAANTAHQQVAQMAAVRAPAEPVVSASSSSALTEAASQPSDRTLAWSAASLATSSEDDFRPSSTLAVGAPAGEARRPRSSWTSRFNEMVQEISAEQASDRMLQLASLNLPEAVPATPVFASLNTGRTYASTTQKAREPRERDFRDLDSRFGVTGSSLSIKF